jgi:putative transposase
MSRIARAVAVGFPHHITQRGNYKQDVFLNDNDRIKYLEWIQWYCGKYTLEIMAFCLMINHVHFVTIPQSADSLALVFKNAHMRYSQYFNKKNSASGHLWQGRFYSCALDQAHFFAALRYVERNPVRANMVKNPWDWPWSSASAHIGLPGCPILKTTDLFKLTGMNHLAWRSYIGSSEESKLIENIRKHSLTGLPLGSKSFIKNMEKNLGRILQALPRGRPNRIPDQRSQDI